MEDLTEANAEIERLKLELESAHKSIALYKERLPSREKWNELVDEKGHRGACNEVSRKLRIFADHIDKIAENENTWPGVYAASVEPGGLLSNSFIESVSVVLSDPWPG